MSAVNVQADDCGDRIVIEPAARVPDVLAMPARHFNARPFHRLKAVSTIDQQRKIEVISTVILVEIEDNGVLEPVRLDVSAERVQLLVRHHREHVGGGVNFVFVAPVGHRCTPSWASRRRGVDVYRCPHLVTSIN